MRACQLPTVGSTPRRTPTANRSAAAGRIAAPLQLAQVNSHLALILRLNGEIDTVMAVRIDDGLITAGALRRSDQFVWLRCVSPLGHSHICSII
jgi:hypothetical protein